MPELRGYVDHNGNRPFADWLNRLNAVAAEYSNTGSISAPDIGFTSGRMASALLSCWVAVPRKART
jgi:hypothetical protein